jgi:hypothetical protein
MVRAPLDTMVAGTSAPAMLQNKQSDTVQILTCAGSVTPVTYMVAVLRTHDAPPLWCNGLASFWPSVAPG